MFEYLLLWIYVGGIPVISFILMVLYQLGYEISDTDNIIGLAFLVLIWPLVLFCFTVFVIVLIPFVFLWEFAKLITGYKDEDDASM